jgi:hypothetical protein
MSLIHILAMFSLVTTMFRVEHACEVENYVHIECEIDKKTLHKLYGLWMIIETMEEPSWGVD